MTFLQACEILKIHSETSLQDAKKAYRHLAQKYHPDKEGGDEQEFKRLNEAYKLFKKHHVHIKLNAVYNNTTENKQNKRSPTPDDIEAYRAQMRHRFWKNKVEETLKKTDNSEKERYLRYQIILGSVVAFFCALYLALNHWVVFVVGLISILFIACLAWINKEVVQWLQLLWYFIGMFFRWLASVWIIFAVLILSLYYYFWL